MPDRISILLALVFAGLMTAASTARAEEFITVNGLPCGTFCRAWMGIKSPAERSTTGAERPASRDEEEREAEPAPRRDETRIHKTRPAKVQHSSVARAKTAPASAETARAKTPAHPADAKQTAEKKVAPTPAAPEAAPATTAPTPVAKETSAPAAPPTPVADQTPAPAAAPSVAPTPLSQETPKPDVAAAPTPVATETTAPVVAAPQPTPSAPSAPVAAQPVASPSPESPVEDASRSTPPPETPQAAAETKDSAATAAGDDKQAPTLPKIVAPDVAAADPGAKTNEEREVLIVLAKLDVKAVADLHDKTIVLAGVAAISNGRLKAAFAAAGAQGAQFKQGAINDVDEVGSGSVAAAIVAVVRPEIASAFPDVPGYRLLRVEVAAEANR